MKILLIGKNGQVGWELRRTLAPLAEVVAVDYPEINFTDAPALRQFVAGMRPDVVVNAAAYTAVDKAETETELCRQINAVAPGIVDTPMHKDDSKDLLRRLQPMGRISEVKDIVDAILYLSEAGQVTGEVLHVDGGAHVGKW